MKLCYAFVLLLLLFSRWRWRQARNEPTDTCRWPLCESWWKSICWCTCWRM